MNKDQLQTIKNLIEQRSLAGHFPEDLEVQESHQNILIKKILNILPKTEIKVDFKRFKIGMISGYQREEYLVTIFNNHIIILEEYPDYLRALEMVLEDTPEDSIAESYLERYQEPNYSHVDTSILLEPLEVKPTIKYVEGTNIAYFQKLEDDDIKRIEQHVLELLEEHIQK